MTKLRPGLVLADIHLADGSSGLDAVNEILRNLSLPVVFVTAFPQRLLTGTRPEPTFLITKPFQSENVKTDGSFVVNGRIALADIPMGLGDSKATVAVWSRNLFNTTYIYRRSGANSVPVQNFANGVPTTLSYSGVLGDYGNFNPPRTFGIEATVSF